MTCTVAFEFSMAEIKDVWGDDLAGKELHFKAWMHDWYHLNTQNGTSVTKILRDGVKLRFLGKKLRTFKPNTPVTIYVSSATKRSHLCLFPSIILLFLSLSAGCRKIRWNSLLRFLWSTSSHRKNARRKWVQASTWAETHHTWWFPHQVYLLSWWWRSEDSHYSEWLRSTGNTCWRNLTFHILHQGSSSWDWLQCGISVV